MIQVVQVGRKEIWLETASYQVVGVYRPVREGLQDIKEWLEVCAKISLRAPSIVVGDWNAHHPRWSLNKNEDGCGRALQEGMNLACFCLDSGPREATFRRTLDHGQVRESRIDLFFRTDQLSLRVHPAEWLLSDHTAIRAEFNSSTNLVPPSAKSNIDVSQLEALLVATAQLDISDQTYWYDNIPGSNPYAKLLSLVAKCMKPFKICEHSKRW